MSVGPVVIPTAQWSFICIAHIPNGNGYTINIYKDGAQAVTFGNSGSLTTATNTNFYLGRNTQDSSAQDINYFKGYLDDVRAWGRVLSLSEIQAIYSFTQCDPTVSPTLAPTTAVPTLLPTTAVPSLLPTTAVPSLLPTVAPTVPVPVIIESPHNYYNNMNEMWNVNFPGYSCYTINFDPQSWTPEKSDYVKIYGVTQGGAVRKQYPKLKSRLFKARLAEFPTTNINADSIEIEFTSDSSHTSWGFRLTVSVCE